MASGLLSAKFPSLAKTSSYATAHKVMNCFLVACVSSDLLMQALRNQVLALSLKRVDISPHESMNTLN